jgi:hypothetical protein
MGDSGHDGETSGEESGKKEKCFSVRSQFAR